MNELLNGIFECLDINSSTGLATEDSLQSLTPFQRLFYTQVHEKIGIDAVYFLRDANGIAKVPLIYFSVIHKYDAKLVAELHRLSWNLGEAPLLFVVTPDEILIYNNYQIPRAVENGNLDPTAGIIETLNLTNGLASQRLALQKYHRSLLESGEYWRQSMTRFDAQSRVDATLMSNLRIMRRTLINQISKRCDKSKEIITSVVHSLLSRSIFIKYLEERKDSNGETVFPQGFYSNFLESAKQYTDVLNSKEATYSLFRTLKEKFNGDTLQVSEVEIEIITQNDLDELRTFILGDSELESKQLALWPLYSFDIILRITSIGPVHQYQDPTLKKRRGYKPTIDFCFRDWDTSNSYFGAECKNLYNHKKDKIHYAMPLRIMQGDVMLYMKEFEEIKKENREQKTYSSKDEFLCEVWGE